MSDERKVIVVKRSEVAAARFKVASDKKRGLKTDPRIVAIANALPAGNRSPK